MSANLRPSCALITAARNEEMFIGQTIESVLSQTVKPDVWVIVSDGSTDRTDDIVRHYAKDHPFIRFVRNDNLGGRSFSSKVFTFNLGYAALGSERFDVVGNLDADIRFEPDYLEFLLGKFAADPGLGIAGTPYVERGRNISDRPQYDDGFVPGACQLFRQACFEAIGGYFPIPGGGEDTVATVMARMKGWDVVCFTERASVHLRPVGTAGASTLAVRFKYGREDHILGNDPWWELARGAFQMTRHPYVLGGMMLWLGYLWSAASGQASPVPPECRDFRRREQRQRLYRTLAALVGLRWPAVALKPNGPGAWLVDTKKSDSPGSTSSLDAQSSSRQAS